MHHQRACRKEPARGSPLGRYAGRPRLTPGLKFEIRPIVRTLARCLAARRLRMKATLPGLAVSTDATWQAEIDQPSQELGMRRMGLSRDWGSCRDGCWRMRVVGGLEAPAGHIAPSAHPQSLNTPAIGSSRKPLFDAGPADLSRLQRSKSSPLHKLVHLSLRYNSCSVWFLDRREMGGAGRLHARVHARPDRR